MNRFIKDMFTENSGDNKYSSKKMMGIISGLLAFLSFVLDAFNFYDVNPNMFEGMLIFSATMLGVSMVRGFTKGGGGVGSNTNDNGPSDNGPSDNGPRNCPKHNCPRHNNNPDDSDEQNNDGSDNQPKPFKPR